MLCKADKKKGGGGGLPSQPDLKLSLLGRVFLCVCEGSVCTDDE